MKQFRIRLGLFIIASAAAVAACGSNGLVRSSATASGNGTVPVVATTPGTGAAPVDGYRRVVMNGKEYFCRTEAVPGSRVQKAEVCLTRVQLEAARESMQAMLRQQQREMPAQSAMMGSMGGMPPH